MAWCVKPNLYLPLLLIWSWKGFASGWISNHLNAQKSHPVVWLWIWMDIILNFKRILVSLSSKLLWFLMTSSVPYFRLLLLLLHNKRQCTNWISGLGSGTSVLYYKSTAKAVSDLINDREVLLTYHLRWTFPILAKHFW